MAWSDSPRPTSWSSHRSHGSRFVAAPSYNWSKAASSKADARDSEQCTAVSKVFANQKRTAQDVRPPSMVVSADPDRLRPCHPAMHPSLSHNSGMPAGGIGMGHYTTHHARGMALEIAACPPPCQDIRRFPD